MSASCSTTAKEISVPNIEGIRIYWRVNNRSIVKRGETIAVYSVDPQKTTDVPLEENIHSSFTGGPVIRAKVRRSRVGTASSCISSKDVTPIPTTTNNKPLLGSLIIKILSNSTQDSTFTSNENDKNQPKGSVSVTTSAASQIPILAPIDGILYIYSTKQIRENRATTAIPSIGNIKQPITSHQILGKVESCSHPKLIDSLCAICGENVIVSTTNLKNSSESSSSLGGESNNSLTVSGGITVSISSDYATTIATETISALRKARKLQLVLDLDHTLVHATADPRAEYWKYEKGRTDVHTILLPMFDGHPTMSTNTSNNTNSPLIKHFMKFRNYLAEFLESVMDKYEVIIYTAGTRAYANKTADAISRHLLNYHRKRENNDSASPYCLDEDDLYALRAKVAEMEYDAKRVTDSKRRKEKVERANEQWKQNNSTSTDKSNDNNMAIEHYDEGETKNSDQTRHENDNAHSDENTSKTLKRKRVIFSEGGSSSQDGFDLSALSSMDDPVSEAHTGKTNECYNINPIERLEILKDELKEAETRENEAIALRMKLFGSRLVSRTDVGDLGRDVKSLSRVFPCGGKMAVIVDDREDVWANADDFSSEKVTGEPPDNLLLTRPFHWLPFLGYADINNVSGVDITKQDGQNSTGTEDDTDDIQLVWTSDILSRLYNRYYSNNSSSDDDREYETVPSILRRMRQEVLGGDSKRTHIVLSGVIPINIQELAASKGMYTRPPLIRYIQALGGNIDTDVIAETTHLVAARDGTEKVKRARQVSGCSVVNVSWVMECYWSVSLRDTTPHLITNHNVCVGGKLLHATIDSSKDESDNFNLDAEYD